MAALDPVAELPDALRASVQPPGVGVPATPGPPPRLRPASDPPETPHPDRLLRPHPFSVSKLSSGLPQTLAPSTLNPSSIPLQNPHLPPTLLASDLTPRRYPHRHRRLQTLSLPGLVLGSPSTPITTQPPPPLTIFWTPPIRPSVTKISRTPSPPCHWTLSTFTSVLPITFPS